MGWANRKKRQNTNLMNTEVKSLNNSNEPVYRIPNKEGGPSPIVNEQPLNLKNPPLNDGTFFGDKTIFKERPFGVNTPQGLSGTINFEDCDDAFTPNLFGTWGDIYGAFTGTYFLKEGPDEIKRHETTMLHLLFIVSRFGMLKVGEKKWLIGNYSTEESDEYGRVVKGQFTPWNNINGKLDNRMVIPITPKNNDLFVTMQLGNYGVPLFVQVSYLVNFRNMLYQFKNINLRLATLHKIIGLSAGGKDVMVKFLNQLFNLDNNTFPVPIQVIDIAADEGTGDIQLNFKDLKNQIDFSVMYKGNEINIDIEGITRELFRVAGLRTDLVSKSGQYQERSTSTQVSQSSTYFDSREKQVLRYFRNFEQDFKEKFGINIKWECVYNDNKEREIKDEKRTSTPIRDV